MKTVAGIDGGGTGTTLTLGAVEGGALQRRKFGPFNINSIGEEQFQTLVREIFNDILNFGDCEAVCFGAAGISNPAVETIIKKIAAESRFTGKLLLKGDHEIALYGAMSGGPGSVLIAGTGSVCVGTDGAGKSARAGGRGHLIDDAGSGYALGRDALSAVVRAADGRGKATELSGLIFDFWSVTDMRQLIAKVYGTFDKSNIASLSPLAETAARHGDEAALTIMEKNAAELVELAASVYRQLGMEEMRLSLLGGLLSRDTVLRREFLRLLPGRLPSVTVKEPDADAAAGAAYWARALVQCSESSFDTEVKKNFRLD